jgi:hypothetical protein
MLIWLRDFIQRFRKPLVTNKSIEFMGRKCNLQVYSKKRLAEALEFAPHGSILYLSPTTYITVYHYPEERAKTVTQSKLPAGRGEGIPS